jgi:hypothetical protein
MVEVGRDFLPTFSSAEKVGRVRLRRIRNRRSFDFAQDDSGGTARGDGRDKAQGKGLLFFLGGDVHFGAVEGQGYMVIFTAE